MLRVALGAMSLLVAFGAMGQVQRSGNDTARVMQQLQQVTAEKTQAQAENARLKTEVEELKAQLAKAASALNASEQRAKKIAAGSSKEAAAVQEVNDALVRTRTQMQDLVAKFRETAQTLRDVETEREQIRAQLLGQERELKTCVDRNAAMYRVSDELLLRMGDRGMWSSLTEKEPFTKISRTRLENLIEDYRYRVDEQRLAEKKSTASAN